LLKCAFCAARFLKSGTRTAQSKSELIWPWVIDPWFSLHVLIELRGAPSTETIDDKVLKFTEVCQSFGKLLKKK
jgi:hypothetical protein